MKLEFPPNWKVERHASALLLFHGTVYYVRHAATNRIVRWNSRDHRKGKMARIVKPGSIAKVRFGYKFIQFTNISWWTSILFIVGSIFWLINGVYIYHMPLFNEQDNMDTGAYFGLLGGLTFLVGGYCMFLEALNVDKRQILYHHQMLLEQGQIEEIGEWRWYGCGDFRDLGFTAAVLQFIGTIIFGIGPITGLPNVLPDPTDNPNIWIILYWLPQVVGATFLILSSYCIMIEVQTKFYKIRPISLGWHVGFWNILGSVGFFISGFVGFYLPDVNDPLFIDGVALSTYVGSYCFLFGSMLQYVELI